MTRIWLRRACLLALGALALALGGCGSSTIESALTPTRLIAFGDGFTDGGNVGGLKYTVNDGTNNTWAEQLAYDYGLSLTVSSSGGLNYARRNARVMNTPDAVGGNAPSLQQQIESFLANNTFNSTDVVLINGGISDLIVEGNALISGTQTKAQSMANIAQAGKDLGALVRRLTLAGAKYVMVVGSYNVGLTPWAVSTARTGDLGDLSTKFNEQLLVSIVDLGNSVLYVDNAYYFNLIAGVPTSYGYVDSTTFACNSIDKGAGIGIGGGEVSSALCTTSTIGIDTTSLTYNSYVFADKVYFTPAVNRAMGDYAYGRLRSRW